MGNAETINGVIPKCRLKHKDAFPINDVLPIFECRLRVAPP